MKIRQARGGDVAEVSHLYLRLNPGRRRYGRVRGLGVSAKAQVLVAEEGSRVLGFLWANLVEYANMRIAYIEELYVDADHRRRGIGSALVSKVLQWLAEEKVPVVFVSTTVGDRAARQFYRARGFHRTRGPWFYYIPSLQTRRS